MEQMQNIYRKMNENSRATGWTKDFVLEELGLDIAVVAPVHGTLRVVLGALEDGSASAVATNGSCSPE
jgi:hypothetical protein